MLHGIFKAEPKGIVEMSMILLYFKAVCSQSTKWSMKSIKKKYKIKKKCHCLIGIQDNKCTLRLVSQIGFECPCKSLRIFSMYSGHKVTIIPQGQYPQIYLLKVFH